MRRAIFYAAMGLEQALRVFWLDPSKAATRLITALEAYISEERKML